MLSLSPYSMKKRHRIIPRISSTIHRRYLARHRRRLAFLPMSLCDMGMHTEAEAIGRQVLALRMANLGSHHPATVQAMYHVAGNLINLGRYSEAEAFGLTTVKLLKGELSRMHPMTTWAVTTLGHALSAQGRHIEAETIKAQILNFRQRILGDMHPDTAVAMADLARGRHALERSDEAVELMKRAIELHKDASGSRHPRTLASTNTLATWQNERRFVEVVEEEHGDGGDNAQQQQPKAHVQLELPKLFKESLRL